MTPYLVDVNLALALLVRQHEHHALVRHWFDNLVGGEAGLCRLVQLALVRLLGNRSVMCDHALSAAAAWEIIGQLLEDERLEFLAEPPGLDQTLPALFRYPTPTPNLITDAYLAAFAIAAQRTLITIDSGFQKFKGLQLYMLRP